MATPQPSPDSSPPANRIAELRDLRGLNQTELGKAAGLSQQTVSKLESGKAHVKMHQAVKLAKALDVAVGDLFSESGDISVPVAWAIASAFSDRAPDDFAAPAGARRFQTLPSVARPAECFAAVVLDDSADRLYPPGSVLVVRPLDFCREALRKGSKVLVRHFGAGGRAGGHTMEVLVGLLDRTIAGDLALQLLSTNRELPPSVTIQPARRDRRALGDATHVFVDAEGRIDYRPRDDDPAEILGVVQMASTPE